MEYQVVYDVLDDGWPWDSVLNGLLALGLFLAYLLARRGGRPSASGIAASRSRLSWWLLVLGGVTVLVFGCLGLFAVLQQRQCKEWDRTGDYEVAEGAVSAYYRDSKPSSERFRVGELTVSCWGRSAGYRGRFNAPGVSGLVLRNGIRARIAHRDGLVLRVEVAR